MKNITKKHITNKFKLPNKVTQSLYEHGFEVELSRGDDLRLISETVLKNLYENPKHYKRINEGFGFENGNKDDHFDLHVLGEDLEVIKKETNRVKETREPKQKESLKDMLEKFRDKYSEHSRVSDMMASLYQEFDSIGDLDEVTMSGGGYGISTPLFGEPQKRSVNETTNTGNSGNFEDGDTKSPFDVNNDGWFWNDKSFFEGGEIVKGLAKIKNNWKDPNFKIKTTKESLFKSVKNELSESTTFNSIWGDNGMPNTPVFAAKDNQHIYSKKPLIKGGKIVQKIINSGIISELIKNKYHKDGKYVKFKDKCVKFNNGEGCSEGDLDKPLILSDRLENDIKTLSKETNVSESKIKEILINNLIKKNR